MQFIYNLNLAFTEGQLKENLAFLEGQIFLNNPNPSQRIL